MYNMDLVDEPFESCPSTCSNSRQETMVEKSFDQTYESIKNLSLSEGEKSKPSGRLIKTTSMEREEHAEAKGRLGRAPSLPASLGLMEEFEDEESEFRMGKLIRQASLVHSADMFPPRPSSKAMAQSCSKPRNRNQQPALKNLNREGLEQMRNQYLASQLIKTSKSLTDLELQGFKDLGFNFDIVQDLNPSLLPVPGLKEKKRVQSEEENMRSPRYISEACMASSSSSSKRSTEDMKKQIKFWARAVASNSRQEC